MRALGCRRGDIVAVALSGDYGKPRTALVIQSDAFSEHPSVTVLTLTSDLFDTPLFRITVQPDSDNGLRLTSQIMVDRAATVPREKVGRIIGRLDRGTLDEVYASLMQFLGD